MAKKNIKRFTRTNHVQGSRHKYRIPMDYAGELTIYGENGVMWISGDLVDKLGEWEDVEETVEK